MQEQAKIEIRLGGILLSLGALLTIICILLEVNAGWASLSSEIKRSDYEAGQFLYANWDVMSSIWNWALFGNVLFSLAALLFIREVKRMGWFPLSLFWAIYFIGSLLLIFSFAVSLGSYFHALKHIEDKLFLFETIRGTPLYLFNIGALMQLSVVIIFFHQGFSKSGIVPKIYAVVTLVIILAAFVMVFLGMASFAVFAVTTFLAPLFLGLFYLKQSMVKTV